MSQSFAIDLNGSQSSQSSQEGFGIEYLKTQLSTWYQRRKQLKIDRDAFKQLETLEDHMLHDIGVTRKDVIWASNLPLSVNASVQLDILARSKKP